MKKKPITVSSILSRFLISAIAFLIIGCFTGVSPVKADFEQKIQLNRCYANGSEINIESYVQGSQYDYVQIYRADRDPSQGGTFVLLDQMLISTNYWYSDSYGGKYWYTSGDNDKITCFSHSCSVDGDVVFVDSTVEAGHSYYYKLVMRSDWEDSWPAISSNVVSATVKLSAPVVTRCHSYNNKNVKLCWSYTPKAKGYQIYKYTGKKWKRIKTINKKSTLAYTDKKVKAGKTYKYKIRSYSIVSGKKIYSSFSSVRKVSLKRPTVRGNYKANSVYGPSLNSSQLMQVRRVVQSFKTNYIRKGMSEYDKALAAFLYLRSNCSYARRGWQYNNANNAWGALVYNEAQCSGFARAMKALCDGVGVKCKYVHANSKAVNPSHQWNEIRINGKWYIVDAQSGFFLAGSNTWKNMMGMRWNTKGLPKCSASDHKKFGFYGSIV